MSNPIVRKPLSVALGAAFVSSLAGTSVASAEQNPFSMTELPSGYMVAEHAEGKCGAAKSGEDKHEEGKCGAAKTEEGASGDASEADAAHGMSKEKAEGKCGEGKCGAAK
jgi:uncharacterized low-complexity protein